MSTNAGASSPLEKIELLNRRDGRRLRAVRLRALRDSPDAFATTFEEVAAQPLGFWERQLQQLATFLAMVNGCDIGMVRGAHHSDLSAAGYLISMWVAPEVRRQGVGSALVDAVVGWARTEQLNRLFLDVAESNTPAIALYTRKGFSLTGESSTLPPPREHIRECQLVMTL